MTEAEAAPGTPPDGPGTPEAGPEERAAEAAPRSSRALPAWLGVIGFVVLAAGIVIAWQNPRVPPVTDAATLAKLSARLDRLAAGLQATETRLEAAEKTLSHLPAPPDLGPIEARLSALEQRPVPAPTQPPAPAPATAATTAARTAATTPGGNAGASAAGPPSQAAIDAALAPLTERLDGLEKSEALLKQDLATIEQKVATTSAPLVERIGGLEQSAAAVKENLATIDRKLAITRAALALAQGRPLGALEGAPPALARFAKTAPPTLAGLRVSFAEAARFERASARPSGADQPLTKRLMDRLGDLFTVREGNQVIIGNPAEPALTGAEAALAAGDLARAVAALAKLPGQPAPAMAQWEDQAKALLAARTAMAQFAGAD